jgi:outer membrane biosynthesis protein TonB
MNNEKTYTAEDFADYHAGVMPLQEMHMLEKAALEDPFLYEALEGYAFAKSPIEEVKKISEKLYFNEDNVKNIHFSTSRNKIWMRIAASIAIVFGLGFLFYTINKTEKDKESSLAKNEPTPQINTDTIAASTVIMDTMPTVKGTITVKSDQVKPDPTEKKVFTPKENAADDVAINNKKSVIAPIVTTSATVQSAPGAVAKNEVKSQEQVAAASEMIAKDLDNKEYLNSTQNQNRLNNYYNYSGIVQKPTGGPMQNAVVRSRNIVTQTDENGRFNFKAVDSNLNASIDAAGFAQQNVLLNTNTVPTFRLDYDKNNLNEVVVSGYGVKSKKRASVPKQKTNDDLYKNKNEALAGKVRGVQVKNYGNTAKADTITNLEFEKDLKNFNIYLDRNLKPYFDNNGNEVKGKVVVSFMVNKKGSPKNIKIVQSLNDECDKQAIDLLENGPKWNKGNGDKKVLSIAF